MTKGSPVRCGNPDCPDKPAIFESATASYEDRLPCPVCGSLRRSFSVSYGEYAGGQDGTQATVQPALRPGDQQNVVVHAPAVSGTLTATDEDDRLTASGTVTAPRVRLAALDGVAVDHEVTLRWLALPGGGYVFELTDAGGVPLVTGHGESPLGAMVSLIRRMLPPGAGGRRDP